MSIPLLQVDAFTETPFAGNPAAVCLLDAARPEPWMQAVAREMNLSETAFLLPEAGAFRLRWFTPSVEVALCGHATLASAHVLWEERLAPRDAPIPFETASGRLEARREGAEIVLDFPLLAPREGTAPASLAAALGCEIRNAAFAGQDLLAEVSSEAVLRGLRPDMGRLAAIPVRGISVTARSESPDFDYVCRFFAPASGVPEDPVTGSAQCSLGPYWAGRLGRSELRAFQASSRGGTIQVRIEGDRVHLGGRAVTVLRGSLSV
ncbi:MAG: PhzF family phenazine biosynthesis protein [Planctomycetes bacterium]|nr:PhzF family phenazine biosynthesis protein [Planctomycetota bacterium]